jgi:tetratricopeptide (TPR) repeat protein
MKELTLKYIPATDESKPRVQVRYRPEIGAQAQERETEFDFSFEEAYRRQIQWYLEEYLLFPWGEFRTRARQTEELMTMLGEQMFEAVFGSRRTSALYAHVADRLGETRIVIQASDPEGIALPWELLRDQERGEYGDLARLAHTFVRSQSDLIFEPSPAPAGDTFNILMVISRPGGPEGDVPFQSVARPMLELFRQHRDLIQLDVLRPPTFEQLSRVLAEKPNYYHVLHFDGHGTFPQGSDGTQFYAQPGQQGLLVFEGEAGKPPREVTGAELGGLLAGKGVPIVLLNACQSGMTHPESLYPSVGNELLKAGCRGVVAMSYSVYVQTAKRFMARLYEGLINGEELGRALALGREDLRTNPQRNSPIGEIDLHDWVVPVLFEAAPVQAIQPKKILHLDLDILQDQQAQAGSEIDTPEPPVFGFVGRDGVVLDLERAFQTETTVLLQGMAGVGKTEMAMGFARWLAETSALDGPIFFFHFEQYLPLAQVYDRVGGAFNDLIQEQLGQDWHLLNAQQRRQVALEILRQVPCLMIWDNFEPVAGFPKGSSSDWKPEEQRELRDFLRDLGGGRTKVLLTSRRDEKWWLGNIYRRVELGGLKLLEAQELALRVMRRAGLKPQEIKALPQYNDLLKYLKGNPLAIQVILPELQRKTPDELLSALKTGEATFGEDDPKLGRDRSLSSSLTYRLEALDPELYQQLGVLALFQGFVDADVLVMICEVEGAPELLAGLGPDEWLGRLDKATEVGLLRGVGQGYYTVHPALPWFFHDLLRETFPDRVAWFEGAFSGVYASYGGYLDGLFKTNTQLAMNLLGAEENNLVYALRLARQREGWDDVSGILFGIRNLYTTQDRWVEWERLVAGVEAEITDGRGEPLPGRESLWRGILGFQAEIADYVRDFEKAQGIYLRLKEHYEGAGDDHNVAVALHQLGRIAEERRQFDEAERWYRQSLEIEERIGDEHGQAKALHQLGMIAEERRQFDEAERWYRQSLEIKERLGNEHGQASTLHQLGMIAQERRQFDEAERWYRQSLEIVERIGDEHGQAITLHQLGSIAQERRQFDEAERWYRQSLEIVERLGNEHGQAITLHQLGRIAQEQGNIEQAVELYKQSELLFIRLNDPYSLEVVRKSLNRVQGKKSNQDEDG